MSAALIELAGIERIFRLGDSEVHALRRLDARISAGEYVAVMGPSGSGKSTLLNLLGLLDRPDGGSYRLEGRDVTTLTAAEQARVRSERIGFVFQSFHLVPRLTAAENIALPMILAGIAPTQRAERVAQALHEAAGEPDVQALMRDAGIQFAGGPPLHAFAGEVRAEIDRARLLVRRLGLKYSAAG